MFGFKLAEERQAAARFKVEIFEKGLMDEVYRFRHSYNSIINGDSLALNAIVGKIEFQEGTIRVAASKSGQGFGLFKELEPGEEVEAEVCLKAVITRER